MMHFDTAGLCFDQLLTNIHECMIHNTRKEKKKDTRKFQERKIRHPYCLLY